MGYYLGDGENEASLGFNTLGRTALGVLSSQFISGVITEDPAKREKNIFCLTVKEGEDAFENTLDRLAGPTGTFTKAQNATHDVVSFGNCTINSYSVNFSVGEIPRVDIEGEAQNIQFNTGSSGLYNPSLNRDGGRADTGQYQLGVPTTGNMDVLVLRPEDVVLSFNNNTFSFGGTDRNDMHVQTASIEVPMSRGNISALGAERAVAPPLSLSSSKKLTDLQRLGSLNVTNRILNSDQSTKIDIGINLTTGATGIDPFYSFQQMQSGFLSTGEFDFKIKDAGGVTTVSGGSLVSYSLDGSVGDLVKGSTSYEGDGAIFTPVGAITIEDQSTDQFGGFFRPRDIEITSTTNGDEGIDTASLNIQNFSLSVEVGRKAVTRLGTRVSQFRYPELPTNGTLSFSVIKTKASGINISSLICESGVILIDLKDINDNSVMNFTTSGCCLDSVDESTNLDDNTEIRFSYYFPIIQ
jgi:hypothetical protein